MSNKTLLRSLDELRELVSGWQGSTEVSPIERDIALERVKKIYEQLRFPSKEEPEEEEVVEPEVVAVEPEPEIVPEVVVELDPDLDPDPDPEIEPEPEEEAEEGIISELIEPEYVPEPLDEMAIKKERRRKILSLYGGGDVAEPSLNTSVNVSELHPASAASIPVVSLASQLSFNDRCLLINDLFEGDGEAMERTIAQLDSAESLDDALIYIAENHSWSGDSEAAKLLLELLESRF